MAIAEASHFAQIEVKMALLEAFLKRRAFAARLFALFALVLFGSVMAEPARADSPIVVGDQSFNAHFPLWMRFTIRAHDTIPINVARLTVWQNGVAAGSRYSPTFEPTEDLTANFTWALNGFGDGGYLPPGTSGEFTWHLEDTAGNQIDTPHEAFKVEDQNHTWEQLSNANLTVFWYSGDAAFGRAIFDRANSARDFLTSELGVGDTAPIQVYIYGDRRDFFDALDPGAAEWTGGRTFPEYGIIMINFDDANLDWGLIATSHELSHAILHAKIKGPLGSLALPRWLDEGLAVYNQNAEHKPDEQFEESFRTALGRDQLLTLGSISQRFPSDSDKATLAYGESYSAVKFLIEKLGAEKFAHVLQNFQDGAAYDDAFQKVYGVNQAGLENLWRKEIGAPPRALAAPTQAAGVIPTLEVSAPLVTLPTNQATSVAEQATPIPPTPGSEAAAPAPAAQTGLCGGVVALGGLMIWNLRRGRRRKT